MGGKKRNKKKRTINRVTKKKGEYVSTKIYTENQNSDNGHSTDEVLHLSKLHIITVYGIEESYSEMRIQISIPGIQKHQKRLINVEFNVRSVEVRVKNLNEINFFFKAYHLGHNIVPEKSSFRINKDVLILQLEKETKEIWQYVHYHHPKFIKKFEESLETFMVAHFSAKPHETFIQQLRHFGESFSYAECDLTSLAGNEFEVTLPEFNSYENDVDKIFDFMKKKISKPSTSMKELYYFAVVLFNKEKLDFELKYPHLSQETMVNEFEKKNEYRPHWHYNDAEALKEEGNSYFKAKLYYRAILSYTKAIHLDSSNAIYFLNRAIAHFHVGEISMCIFDAKEALNLNPFYSEAYLYLGKSFLSLCCPIKATACLHYAKCLDYYNWIIKDEIKKLNQLKDNINVYITAVINDNNFLRSIILKEISRSSPVMLNVHKILIEELCKINKVSLAKKEANIMHLNCHPRHKDASYYMLAICCFYEDDEIGVHDNFKESLKINKSFKSRYEDIKTIFTIRNKGDQFYKRGNFEESINAYQKGLADELPCTVYASFLYKISCAKFKLHKHREAFEFLEKAIVKHPDYHQALSARGEYYTNEGKFQQALEDFKKASKIFPCINYTEKIKKVRQLQTRYQPKQRTKPWVEKIDSKLKRNSKIELAESKRNEGNELYDSQRYEEATKAYTEAINLNPDNQVFYSNRSACFMMLKKYDKALNDCKAALKLDPLFEKVLLRYSKCSVILGNVNDAVRILEVTFQHNPNISTIIDELSRVKKILKMITNGEQAISNQDYKKAEQYYSEAVVEVELCKKFHRKRIECMILSESYEDAVSASKFAISLDFEDSTLFYYMGLCFIYEDDRNKAIEFLAKSVKIDPNNERAANVIDKIESIYNFRELGDVAYLEKEFPVAFSYYEKGINKIQKDYKLKAIFHNNIGLIFMKEVKIEDAILNFTTALEFQADYVNAYINRAECYLQLNHIKKALNDYEVVNKIFPCSKNEKLVQVTKKIYETGIEGGLGVKELEKVAARNQLRNGEKCHSDNRFDETIKCYVEASILTQYSLLLYIAISKCHIEMENVNKAIETFKKAREVDSKNVYINKGIVRCLQLKKKLGVTETEGEQKNASGFLNHYKSTCEVSNISSFLLKVAESLIDLRLFDDVASLLDSVPDELKETSDIYCLKGLYSYYQKDDNADLEYINKALEIDPSNESAVMYKNRIDLVYEKKKMGDDAYLRQSYTDALKFYEEGLLLDPENHRMQAKFHHNIGAMYMNQSKFNKSISSFTEAINFKKDYIKALEKRAKCYKNLNEIDKAIKDYEELFEITSADKYEEHIQELKNLLKNLNLKNYYHILGVFSTASMDEIRKAYKRLAREFHPDKLMTKNKEEGEEKFKNISKAYDILSDPLKREQYDRGETENDIFTSFAQPFMPDSFARMFFEMFANQNVRSNNPFYFS